MVIYIYIYIFAQFLTLNTYLIMKKLWITLTLSLMVLGGIALCFQSNADLATSVGAQDEIAMSAQAQDVCYRCKGKGKCTTCSGKGYIVGYVKRKCSDCRGTGVCQRCKGSGKDPVWKKSNR